MKKSISNYISNLMNRIDNKEFTAREILLSGAVLFLSGILLGLFLSPKKYSVFGSNNGSNNGNGQDDGSRDSNSIEESIQKTIDDVFPCKG